METLKYMIETTKKLSKESISKVEILYISDKKAEIVTLNKKDLKRDISAHDFYNFKVLKVDQESTLRTNNVTVVLIDSNSPHGVSSNDFSKEDALDFMYEVIYNEKQSHEINKKLALRLLDTHRAQQLEELKIQIFDLIDSLEKSISRFKEEKKS